MFISPGILLELIKTLESMPFTSFMFLYSIKCSGPDCWLIINYKQVIYCLFKGKKLNPFVLLSEEVLRKMVITLEFCTYTNKDHNLNTTFLFFPFFSQLKNKFLIISSLDWIQFLVFESFSIINSLSCT